MKAITYALVAFSLLWIDTAWRAVMTQPQIVVVYRVPAQPASYVVPVQECSRQCRAKARAIATSQRFALKEGK